MWAVSARLGFILSLLPAHLLLRPSFWTGPHLCYVMPSLLLSAATLILGTATASAWLLSLHPSSSWSYAIGESLVIYRSKQSNSSFRASYFTALIPILFFNWLSSLPSHEIQKKRNLIVRWKLLYFSIFILLSEIISLCEEHCLSLVIPKILMTVIDE